MIRPSYSLALEHLAHTPNVSDPALHNNISLLLEPQTPQETQALHQKACEVRNLTLGARLAVRALVEISSYCANDCFYCGLNKHNPHANRYQLSTEDIIESALQAHSQGVQTVVLQSGEDGRKTETITNIIRTIKQKTTMAITLSLGERSYSDFLAWRTAGADRYLLRVETTCPKLYASIHGTRTLASRLECLHNLQSLGYQTGSGIMIGFPGQTISHIASDIIFFAQQKFAMIGIGPFIPHPETPFKNAPSGSVSLCLHAIAITRLLLAQAWMPATTALGSLERDWRIDALNAGANVLMPNATPPKDRSKYSIYPGKCIRAESPNALLPHCAELAQKANLALDKV